MAKSSFPVTTLRSRVLSSDLRNFEPASFPGLIYDLFGSNARNRKSEDSHSSRKFGQRDQGIFPMLTKRRTCVWYSLPLLLLATLLSC